MVAVWCRISPCSIARGFHWLCKVSSHMLTKMLVPGVPLCTQGTQLTQNTYRRGRGAASPFVPLGSSCSRGAGRWRAAGFPLLVLAQLRGEAVIHLLSCSQVSSKSTSHPVTVPISHLRLHGSDAPQPREKRAQSQGRLQVSSVKFQGSGGSVPGRFIPGLPPLEAAPLEKLHLREVQARQPRAP